ncbi:MAG: peptidase A2 [Alphaproteobacteria bacterium]|nr:peptidase A2 [Alphaproteobacteria bacterium]
MIDTGAHRTVLSPSLAEQLGLEAGPQIRVVGIVQDLKVPSAKVGSLDLGPISLTRMQGPLLDRAHMGAHGIIGTDTLQDQRVLLDFSRELMTLGDAGMNGGNAGYEIVVRARRETGQLVIANARLDGINVAVVIDTGAETSIGNRALQAEMGRRGQGFTPVLVESVTGHSVLAEVGAAESLTIRDVVITNPAIAFTDTPAFDEIGLADKPILFLGMREMRMFRRVAIDFPRKRVLFDLPG